METPSLLRHEELPNEAVKCTHNRREDSRSRLAALDNRQLTRRKPISYFRASNRRRAAPATPTRPVPKSNMLAGSGTGVLGVGGVAVVPN